MGHFNKWKDFASNAGNVFTGKKQAGIASAQQKKQMNQALDEYNTYSGDNAQKYDDSQRAVVDEQATGRAASVGDYDRTTANPLSAAYEEYIRGGLADSMGGSLGGMASRGVERNRSQGVSNANKAAYMRAQSMAGGMKQSALENLQQAASGRANIHQGMASQVQADPSLLTKFNAALSTYKNMMAATAAAGK